jgi:hypothetical protein
MDGCGSSIRQPRQSANSPAVNELRDVARKLQSKGFRAVIIDLRTVQSGEVRHAAMIADLFLAECRIGSAVVQGRREEFASSADRIFVDWPMAVLVDHTTKEQAEWIAASLLQRPNTILMGRQTPGLGFVRDRIRLADGSSIELRTGFFQRADGRSLVSEGADESRAVPRRAVPDAGPQVSGLPVPTSPVPGHPIERAAEPLPGWNGILPDIEDYASVLGSAAKKLDERLSGHVDFAR